jgi:hypothetical protein
MLNLRNKTVNVDRIELLNALKSNLEVHKAQYNEAITDYKTKLKLDVAELAETLEQEDLSISKLSKLRITFEAPADHSNDYIEAIEMLEMSVDSTIQLDEESFKAYIKNKWRWSDGFNDMLFSTKSYISGKLG